MAKIARAFYDGRGNGHWVDVDGESYVSDADSAEAFAAANGQRIIRNPDWSCTIEDLPKPKTALQIIDEVIGYYAACPPTWMTELREAILEGRAS